jgi:ATP adenylyltransferase
MERLHAPWRIEYIVGHAKEPGCVFCSRVASHDDDANLIVHRARGAFTIMNKFPYANGHLLVCPYRHVADLCDLTAEESGLIVEEVKRGIQVLREVMRPSGFNVGLNLGTDAGAGIDEHLHYHVVPRWRGDNNFIAVLADVRVIPEHFLSTSRKVRDAFHKLFPGSDEEVGI